MMKAKPFLYFTGFAVLAAAGTYYYFKIRNKDLEKKNAPDPAHEIPVNTYNPSIPTRSPGFPLKIGSRGPLVTQLQQNLGMPVTDQDGSFGPKTEAALLAQTRQRQVLDQAQLDHIKTKTQTYSAAASRKQLALDLLHIAEVEKSNIGNYILQPNKNIRAYQSMKILFEFFHTNQRLSDSDSDYYAFTPYPNVKIVQVNSDGFLIMYDYGSKKYFYASPYDWIMAT